MPNKARLLLNKTVFHDIYEHDPFRTVSIYQRDPGLFKPKSNRTIYIRIILRKKLELYYNIAFDSDRSTSFVDSLE